MEDKQLTSLFNILSYRIRNRMHHCLFLARQDRYERQRKCTPPLHWYAQRQDLHSIYYARRIKLYDPPYQHGILVAAA